MAAGGFPRPPERKKARPEPEVEAPPLVDPRYGRNRVRSVVSGLFAQSSGIYEQLSQVAEADLPLSPEALTFLRQALQDFAHFHDSIGGMLGELAPSHSDRDLFPEE